MFPELSNFIKFIQVHDHFFYSSIAINLSFTYRWIFRSHDLAPNFSVMPITKCKGDTLVPPIYSIVSFPSSLVDQDPKGQTVKYSSNKSVANYVYSLALL